MVEGGGGRGGGEGGERRMVGRGGGLLLNEIICFLSGSKFFPFKSGPIL